MKYIQITVQVVADDKDSSAGLLQTRHNAVNNIVITSSISFRCYSLRLDNLKKKMFLNVSVVLLIIEMFLNKTIYMQVKN